MAAFFGGDIKFDNVLASVLKIYNIKKLKNNQETCIRLLADDKRDVLAVLPTGYGKSLIYQILPKLYEEGYKMLHGLYMNFTIIVVSPLEYIRKQQVTKLKNLGIKAANLDNSNEVDEAISNGQDFEIIFGSAEQWLSPHWKKALQTKRLANIIALVVDEVHTVELWGTGNRGKCAFREAFGRIGELRSYVPDGTPLLGLTATACKEMRQRLQKYLGMRKGETIIVSPNKLNIRFTVMKVSPSLCCFDWLVALMLKEREQTPFTIIFCQTVNDIVTVLSYLLEKLGRSGVYTGTTKDTPLHEQCLVGVYYSQTPDSHKDLVTNSFEGNGPVRVVIASSSLSMGVDFHHVTYVIHFGPSKNLTQHLQSAGRGGRDGSQAFSLTVFLPKHIRQCDKQMKKAVNSALNSCARVALLKDFDEEVVPLDLSHNCCGFCHKQCKCGGGDKCLVPVPVFDSLPEYQEEYGITFRTVSDDDRKCTEEALRELQLSLTFRSNLSVLASQFSKPYELPDSCIKEIVKNIETISTVTNVLRYCPTATYRLAVVILDVLNEIFGDIDITDGTYCISVVCPLIDETVQESDSIDCMDDDPFPEEVLPYEYEYSSDELP